MSNKVSLTLILLWLLFSHVHLFCNSIAFSLPGSSVHEISQARTLEWVTMPSSRGSSQPRDWTCASCIGRQILYHWRWKSRMNKLVSSSTFKKLISWHLAPSLPWQIDGEKKCKQWQTLFSWAPKSLQTVTAAMQLRDGCSSEEKLRQPNSVQFSR